MLRQIQRYKREILITAGLSLSALLLGAGVSAFRNTGWLRLPWESAAIPPDLNLQAQQPSRVLALATRSPQSRTADLEQLAQGSRSLDQVRARYLLATDLINQNRGGSALPLLDQLEQDYPPMAAMVLAKRAQAYTATGDSQAATNTWKTLLADHGDDPAAADALFALGKTDPQYLDQLLQRFPSHPRSLEVVQARLQQTPNDKALLLLLAKHGLHLPSTEAVLNRLMDEFGAQLTPDDWQTIAFGFWELGQYGNAGYAYERAPATSLNRYRAGRGAQLGRRTADAIAHYENLVKTFPDADDTALGLLRLSRLSGSPQTAIAYADQIIQRFPDKAAEALLERAKRLDELNSPQSASQARQSVLSQYGQSEAAAELRWTLAEQRIKAGDIRGAWELAAQIVKQNPDSEFAPEAAFWVGKWAKQAGQEQEAKTAFEHVLTHYPESYYAWRSAVYLGWDVGDFTTVRRKTPAIAPIPIRPIPPAGSETLKELYQLGQDRDAWTRWQVEFSNRQQPTVAEQFTDGLMRLGVGDNLDGIFMVSSLSRREPPDEQAAYRTLKQQPAYWQALYPFPFFDAIQSWAQQRQLNPVLVTALIRQESRFEPQIVSSAGAVGLMQVMPSTADWIAPQANVPQFDLNKTDDNIKLGTWYLDYTHREYADNSLFAVASYNAGPGAVGGWISRFGFTDPDLFVEQIPYPETKGYVESVFGNYWNYLRLYDPEVSQKVAAYSDRHVDMVNTQEPPQAP